MKKLRLGALARFVSTFPSRTFGRYFFPTAALLLLTAPPALADNFTLDPAFVNSPQFHQKSWPTRVTSGPSGKTYVTFSNGSLLSGVNNQRRGAVIRLNADGTADLSFNVGAQFANAWAVVEQVNGQVLVGGVDANESDDSGLPLYRVFRVNSNGSRDLGYRSPVFTGIPRYMTLQPDGKLLVSQQGGTPNGGLNGLQRLNSDGSLDTAFTPPALPNDGFSSFFSNIVVDASGRILVGGAFSTIAGQSRPGIARLLSSGALDTTFAPSGFLSLVQIRGIAIQTQGANAGKIVIAGGPLRTTTGTQTACPSTNTANTNSCALLRLNADGLLDTSFTLVNRVDTGVISNRPRLLGILPDDKLVIVSSGVARFNADGSLDSSYTKPVFSLETFWMDATADGRVYVPLSGGSTLNGNASSQAIVRFNADGTTDTAYAPGTFQREVYPDNLALLPGGSFLTWGRFDTVSDTTKVGAARFNADGTLDNSYALSGVTNLLGISSAGALTDGRLLAAISTGTDPIFAFTPGIARFTASGALDTTFTPDAAVAAAQSDGAFGLDVQPDGTALVWALTPQRLIDGTGLFFKRLMLSGAIDSTFSGISGTMLGAVFRDGTNAITSIAVGDFSILARYADGRLLASATTGAYQANANTMNVTLMRLQADGTIDTGFAAPSVPAPTVQGFASVPSTTQQLAVTNIIGSPFTGALPLADGGVIVYGAFSTFGGQTAPGIARLTSSGAVDSAFSAGTGAELRSLPGRNPRITHVAVDANGKYWVSGMFDTFGGQSAAGLVRLNSNGSVDSTFSTTLVYSSYVGGGTRVLFDATGRPMVLGTFKPGANGFPDAIHRLIQSQPLDLVASWNLVGNGSSTPLNVATTFGDPSKVVTVWKWSAANSNWAFYSPTLTDGGAAYATSKNFSFLTTINPGEGFWVNAKQTVTSQLLGNPVPSNTFADGLVTNALPTGWSLIAIGDNRTPAGFTNAIATNPPAAGTSVASTVTTLWAWDATLSGWYFFAPSLVNAGTQATYIASKNFLDFGSRTLTPSTGFWVNKP
ncbi:MAG: hypothetical protein D4R74_05105 [Betaproteobacteria bacterium]|nr:MAG: hypothetical protein D4R74_05105 [Betaproteobacteria bacterium]